MQDIADENDFFYETYSLDLFGILRFFYEKLTGGDWSSFLEMLTGIWDIYSIIALLLSLLFIIGFIYAKIRQAQLSEIEQEALREAEAAWALKYGEGSGTRNARWDIIQKRLAENNPESWRIAIIEADILLEETLTDAGYAGATLGEKLKSGNPNSFTTLQDAWEAHKVRNEIAHAGSDFVLTQKIARETILRYERVFREFGIL